MARIATMEEIEMIRDEQDVGDEGEKGRNGDEHEQRTPEAQESSPSSSTNRFIATSREVQDAFDSVNTLRYSQPAHLQGKCQGLTITPFNAGHTIGGTIWKIRSPSSGTILYAVNINHMKERHLDGTVLLRTSVGGVFEPLARPDLLITDAERASVISSRRKDRDAAFIDTVTTTLSSRSSLLLPCDSSTRILELLVLLDQHWNYSRLRYPICFLSRSATEMLTFVRSMMEWLGGTISKEDVGEDGTSSRPERKRRRGDDEADEEALGAFALRFKHLEFFPTPQALIQKYSSKDPKLILAVPASLSHGPSRQLFCDFAAIPDNVILLTERCEEGTLGRILFDMWNERQRTETKWDNGKIGSNVMMDATIKLKMNAKVPLQGAELEAHLQKERAAREKEQAAQAALARNQRMLEADEDDSDSDTDDDEDEEEVRQALGGDDMDIDGQHRKGDKDRADWNMDDEGITKQLLSYDIYLKGNVSKATSFFKTVDGQAPRFRMFPYVEKKRRVDDYGETIDVGMWLRKSKILEEEAESDDIKDYRRRQAEEELKRQALESPSKFVSSEVEVQMACRLLFVDMEGLSDGRAIKTIIPQIGPRKMACRLLIVVHASEGSTNALIESCANIRAMTKEIYAPTLGESIQIGQQISNFSISISDELLQSLKMSRFEDNEVGFVTGRVVAHASSIVPILEPVSVLSGRKSADEAEQAQPRLLVLGSRPAATLPSSTMIGELKLTALKSRLTAIGIHAELAGEGVLICGATTGPDSTLENTVAVRKTGVGRVELEGNVSDVYYAVRKEIYNLHALVAA
ncbi:cleavage and polyadenylation specificity factor subunit [Moniliophthora roreri]|uniref:Cleavage and polyadenylation specificity factor subunit 2 n=1 Tax=Moniliophthora roreri TaxID=221103 RepID=A0A0W0EZA5_MONRR|nr:cleavage and polyadenylation specificity factor subunit [Moniliophthora roreri]